MKKGMFKYAAGLLVALQFVAPASAQREPPWQAMNEEAFALFQAGKYDKSIQLSLRALDLTQRSQNPESQGAVVALNRIADGYRLQARFGEAEPYYERATRMIEKSFGPGHRLMGMVATNFGMLRLAQGRLPEAEAMLGRSLAIRERDSVEAYSMALTLGGLAHLYVLSGQTVRAEAALERAIAVSEKARGIGHPEVAGGLVNLGAFYGQQRRYGEAEAAYKRALAIWENTLDRGHPRMADSLAGAASINALQDEYDGAEALYERALEIRESTLGPNHPKTIGTMEALAEVYFKLKRTAKAEKLEERALDLRTRKL